MSYYAEVILEDDLTDEPHIVDGERTRYEELRRIARAAGNPWSHVETVEFERTTGETFIKKCVFLDSGEME